MSKIAQSVAERQQSSSSGSEIGTLTVSLLVDRYMAAYAGRDVARSQRLSWWVVHLGSVRVADLTDDHIFFALDDLAGGPGRHYVGRDADDKPIIKARKKKLAPATLNRYQVAFQAVCTWAIRKRLTPRGWINPCARLEKPAENNERVRFLSDAERARLFAACKASSWDRLYLLVLMAITTGGRKSELIGLRWGDLDLQAGTASIELTKNKDRRVLPLTETVVELLKAIEPRPVSGHVFPSARRPLQAYQFTEVWRTAVRAAKVKDFRFHDLRHSCASYLAQSGATLLEIADVLGHRQLAVTKRYSHLTVQHKAKLVNRVLGDLK